MATIKEMFDEAEKRCCRPYAAPEARRDLRAFNLLNQLVPGTKDMVACAEHDQIWLAVSPEQLAQAGVTQSQVDELVECGVFYDKRVDSLSMHV